MSNFIEAILDPPLHVPILPKLVIWCVTCTTTPTLYHAIHHLWAGLPLTSLIHALEYFIFWTVHLNIPWHWHNYHKSQECFGNFSVASILAWWLVFKILKLIYGVDIGVFIIFFLNLPKTLPFPRDTIKLF